MTSAKQVSTVLCIVISTYFCGFTFLSLLLGLAG